MDPSGQPQAPVFETTWLEGIVEFSAQDDPKGGKILTYVLGNGHRYVIPLNGALLAAAQKAVSPVVIANSMPTRNGA